MPQSYLDSQSTYVDKDNMVGMRKVTRTASDTVAVTPEDSFGIFVGTKGSATQLFTLPVAATCAGAQFTFVCGHASGEILVDPDDADDIKGTVISTAGADVDSAALAPADNTGIKNTAASNVLGDSITLVSDGVTTWFVVGLPSGVWASQ